MKGPYTNLCRVTGKYWHCDVAPGFLSNVEALSSAFKEAIDLCDTTIIKMDAHAFDPEGVTIVAILADSHAVLHTWPEISFVLVEIFTCGQRSRPVRGIAHLSKVLRPSLEKIEKEFISP